MRLPSVPEILCHHCGQDYAREYWAMGLAADPRVCKSCRRDLNRDAADAPRWTPTSKVVLEAARVQLVSPSPKQCRTCGGVWDGLIFGPPPCKDAPLPFGICPACSAKDEASAVPEVPLGVPLTLARPQRTLEGADA